MTNEQTLESIGLSQNEAKVYLTLNKLGSAPAGKIAEEAKLHRTNVYDALDRLFKKGLVSHFTKDNIKIFNTTSPGTLLNLLNEKKLLLESIMPTLTLNHQLSNIQTKASVFEGVNSFKNALYSFLEVNKPILVYGIPKYVPELVQNWIMNFHKERIAKKILMKHIYNAGAKERIDLLNKMPYTESTYLPKEYDSPVSTVVCGQEVLICLWAVKPLLIIRIENPQLAKAYEKYFELLNSLTKK